MDYDTLEKDFFNINTLTVVASESYDSFAKSFDEYGMAMPCIRLEDKLNRFKALTIHNHKQKVEDESVRDTLEDLANYAIMTVLEIEQEEGKFN